MTPEEFATALSRTRIKPASRSAAAARRYLVDGLTNKAAIGRKIGTTHATVRHAIAVVERAHRDIVGCPPGWVVVTVCVPAELGREIEGSGAEGARKNFLTAYAFRLKSRITLHSCL